MRLLLLIMTTITLTGCSWLTKIEYVDRPIYITKYRAIGEQYLGMCPAIPPPDADVYKSASDRERVDMWIYTYSKQLESTRIRNIKIQELIEINKFLDEEYNSKVEVKSEH